MAQSFAEFKSSVAGTDPITVSPRDKKTSFSKFKSSYGRKQDDEDEEEKTVVTPFNFSAFGLTDTLGSTKTTTPQTTTRTLKDDVEVVKKAAKGTFRTFKALAQATTKKEEFKEGFDIGLLQSSGAIQTSLSRVFSKMAEENPQMVRTKDGHEFEMLPRGKHIPAFFQMVSDKLAGSAKEDFKLSESLNMEVEHPETFSQAIQDPEFISRGVGQNLPNLLAAFGIGAGTLAATKNPIAAGGATFGSTGTLEFGFAYEDAKKHGLSDEDADNAAMIVGTANGMLDTIPIGRALNRIPAGDQIRNNMLRQISKDITGQMATEAGTESLQEIVGNAVAMSYNENQELLEGVPEAMYFGGLLGGGTTLATHLTAGGVRGLEVENIFDDDGNVKPQYSDLVDAKTAFELNDIDPAKFETVDSFVDEYQSKKNAPTKNNVNLKALNESGDKTVADVISGDLLEKYSNVADVKVEVLTEDSQYFEDFKDNKGMQGMFALLENDEPIIFVRPDLPVNQISEVIIEEIDHAATFRSNPDFFFDNLEIKDGKSNAVTGTIDEYQTLKPEIAAKKNVEKRLLEQKYTEEELGIIWESAQTKEEVSEVEEVSFLPAQEAQEEFDRAEFEVITEMELAEAGTRLAVNGETRGIPSTFPDWIPEHLRSRRLFDQVVDLFNEGNLPKNNATKQAELLDVIQTEIASRISAEAKDTVALQQIAAQSPIKAGIVKKAKSAPSARRILGIDQSPAIKVRETALLKERMRTLARGSRYGLKEGRKLQAQMDKVKNDKKLSEVKRSEELKRLRQRIKDRESFTSRGAREATASTKRQIKTIQKRLVGIIEQSNLDKKDQNKFMKLVTNIQTTEQLQKALPEIETRILTLGAKSDIRLYINKIKKLLKATKVKKQSGKPAGKFTADVQQILDDAKKYVKMSREEGQELILKNLEPYTTTDTFPPDAIVRENVMIDTFSGLNTKSVADLKKAADFLEYVIETGKVSAELKKFNRSEQIARQKSKVIDVLTGGEGIPDTVKTTGIKQTDSKTRKEMVSNYFSSIGKSIVGWKDVLDMLSVKDKESDPYKSFISRWGDVIDEQRQERGGMLDQTTAVRDMIRNIYDIQGDREVIKHIAELNKEVELGTFKNADGKDVELVFTRDELIKRHMEMQDPTLTETFDEGMGYTQEIKDAITDKLTKEDIAFAEAQLAFYRSYYSGVNDVYREMYGVNLPKNEFYSPIKREGVAEAVTGAGDFLQDITSRASVAGSSLKSRVKNVHPLKQRGSTSVMEQHVTQMEHFKAWAEKLRDMQTVFNDPQVRTAMELNHGRDIIGVVDSFLNDMARGSEARAFRTAALDKLRARFSRAVLSVKPSIFVKQLTSFLAYADSVPVGSFTKGQIDFWKAPVEHTKFLLEESTMLKTRGQNINRDLAVALKSDEYNFFREKASFLNSLTLNIKAGDQGAIVAGGWSAYKHHYDNAIKEGKTEEEAKKIGIEEFERITESTQQSAELSEQSAFQRGGSIAKLFTMFLSTPNQYFRKELGAVRNTLAGRGSMKQHAKTIFIFHFMLPMLFQFVSDFFRFNKEQQLRAALLGSLNGWFIVGDALDYLLRKALGQQTFNSEISLYSISNDMGKAIDLLLKDPDEVDTDDVMRGIRGFAGATGSLTGTPLKQGVDAAAAVDKVFEGEYEQGIGQFLGWSPYVMEQATAEEAEETTNKKKKKKTQSTTEKKKKKKKVVQ